MKGALLAALVVLALRDTCLPTVIPVPPTEQSIQGVWIGLPSESNGLCRLVLTNGRGVLALSFEMETPMLYTVDSWSLGKARKITLKLSPTSTNAFPILVSGVATHSRIRVVITSPDGGWRDETILYREEKLEGRLQDLRKSMAQFGKR